MFGIFCNNKLVKNPICLVKISRYFVKISEFLVKNPEIFVKKLIFFGKIFNIFGKQNKHDVLDIRRRLNGVSHIGFSQGVTIICLLSSKFSTAHLHENRSHTTTNLREIGMKPV